jgi:hypothetical protein
LAGAFCVSTSAAEDRPTADKSAYTFFNRTPESQLRELSTDRPDLTESPYTLDAGWWMLEMDLATYSRDHDTSAGADVKTTALTFANLNLKVGLTSSIDLQTIIESYTRQRVDDRIADTRETISGFGDIMSRLKINLWGNDGGDSAFALMPYIKWPTSQHGLGNHSIEGGFIVPYARKLGGGWDVGVMTEIQIVRNTADTGYQTDWLNTATFSHDIVGNLGGYLELTYLFSRGGDQATFDCGLTYGVTRNVQLDAGVNLGLTKAAPDFNPFVGLSVRF